MNLSIHYYMYQQCEDEEKYEAFGDNIFKLIMPYAQKFDPRLIHWIPKPTLKKYHIDYEDDDFHIKSFQLIENSQSYSDDGSRCSSSSSMNSNSDDSRSKSQESGDESSNE